MDNSTSDIDLYMTIYEGINNFNFTSENRNVVSRIYNTPGSYEDKTQIMRKIFAEDEQHRIQYLQPKLRSFSF